MSWENCQVIVANVFPVFIIRPIILPIQKEINDLLSRRYKINSYININNALVFVDTENTGLAKDNLGKVSRQVGKASDIFEDNLPLVAQKWWSDRKNAI